MMSLHDQLEAEGNTYEQQQRFGRQKARALELLDKQREAEKKASEQRFAARVTGQLPLEAKLARDEAIARHTTPAIAKPVVKAQNYTTADRRQIFRDLVTAAGHACAYERRLMNTHPEVAEEWWLACVRLQAEAAYVYRCTEQQLSAWLRDWYTEFLPGCTARQIAILEGREQ